jgi:2',3'-cyclic-nucleotide 2'-phosphodiesterase (5'-nucleotidase family)
MQIIIQHVLGYVPERVICELPTGLYFDGRSAIVRSQQTHLTRALCQAMIDVSNTSICVFNSGAIRIDDQLMDTITEYDILRCLPFAANIITIKVNGSNLVKALNRGLMSIHTGMFVSYAGLEYDSFGEKWYLQSNRQLIDDKTPELTITTIPYFQQNTLLSTSSKRVNTYNTMTRAFIDYLQRTYTKGKQ